MILPTKHLAVQRSLLGVGSDILRILEEPMTVSRLWEEFKRYRGDTESARVPFDWFILALDLLYAVGAIEHSGRRLARGTQE